jgi:hypothetical protein
MHKWNLVLVHLGIVLILTQDRCIVYAERTIGSAIILDAHDRTPRCVGHDESCIDSFGNSIRIAAR